MPKFGLLLKGAIMFILKRLFSFSRSSLFDVVILSVLLIILCVLCSCNSGVNSSSSPHNVTIGLKNSSSAGIAPAFTYFSVQNFSSVVVSYSRIYS